MKKNTKRFLSVLFGVVMATSALAAFAGCGGGGGDEGGAGGDDESNIPLDVDMSAKPTLNIHMQSAAMEDAQFNSSYTASLIEQITGYKVNYSQLPSVDDDMAVTNLFVNRTKYHAVKVTKAQYNLLMADDALLNIKPALEKYGQDMLKDITDYSWSVVSRNGGIYGIPEGGPPTPGQQNVSDTIIFRKDLLKDEGFALPETRDEFTEILRHFKQKYGADYRPFTFTQDDSLIPAIAVSFGIYQEWTQDENGEWKFYIELPQYKEYMQYMTGLYNEGLIDLEAWGQDKAKAMAKFGQGKSIAIALGVWDSQKTYDSLLSNKQVSASDNPLNILDCIKGFEDPNGVKNRTYHEGGYSYVTVIPWYMNEEAAYTVDYLNQKIKEENFKKIMIGDEGVHWEYSSTDKQYHVVDKAKFTAEKDPASFYATGINEVHYPEYFLCRIDGQTVVKKFFLYLNDNADEEATYNPLNFTSLLPFYDSHRLTIEKDVRNGALNMMFRDKNLNNYDTVLNKFYSDGGTKAKAEIKAWCEANDWHY